MREKNRITRDDEKENGEAIGSRAMTLALLRARARQLGRVEGTTRIIFTVSRYLGISRLRPAEIHCQRPSCDATMSFDMLNESLREGNLPLLLAFVRT